MAAAGRWARGVGLALIVAGASGAGAADVPGVAADQMPDAKPVAIVPAPTGTQPAESPQPPVPSGPRADGRGERPMLMMMLLGGSGSLGPFGRVGR